MMQHPHQKANDSSGLSHLRLVAWETTRRCHLQCKHCRGAARNEHYEGELSEAEGKLLIDSIASFAKPILILTGGEPMLREDIYRLARYATDRSIRVVMSPCGHLITKESAQLIKESGIQRISISLDGANAQTHDAFRGVPGAFDAALRGIGLLREAGIEFQINTTVTKHNRDELQGILDEAKRLGASFSIRFFSCRPAGARRLPIWSFRPRSTKRPFIGCLKKAAVNPSKCDRPAHRILTESQANKARLRPLRVGWKNRPAIMAFHEGVLAERSSSLFRIAAACSRAGFWIWNAAICGHRVLI